jgi:hypothetical protein
LNQKDQEDRSPQGRAIAREALHRAHRERRQKGQYRGQEAMMLVHISTHRHCVHDRRGDAGR